ncbi:helix-turn-helix transcriptional regulator [Pseudomonas beijingensis]|uniref:helix-turn-helix domain-containing protein n=1 Tax=Pseudomonas beijingensis TaxID=2954101 RepID=UPI002733184C|nr:helix-turn-helix transcriptional regulator [Pseudomonas sp. FP830]WLI47480.1 helix-turn-helix transcriptional regulator [Pseudomonas sp. FP830]
MDNFEIARQIEEDSEVFVFARRAAPVFEIRRVMAAKGLKNIDVAERLGVSEANVSRWLKGDQNLKLDTIYLLADAIQEKLNICFGEAQVRSALSHLSFSETEADIFEVENGGLCSAANSSRYGFNDGEVEANEGSFAFN